MRWMFGCAIALACVSMVRVAACGEFTLHVCADAADGGNGEEHTPFGTLSQARDGIRRARKAGVIKPGEAVTVLVASGTYRLQASFELGAEDSGTAEVPVVYRGQNRGDVRVQGGSTLAAEAFHPVSDEHVLARLDPAVRGKVVMCDVSELAGGGFASLATAYQGVPVGPWLYVDGRPMTLARWPNVDAADGGWAFFTKVIDSGLPRADATDPALRKLHAGVFEFDDPRPGRWNLDRGVWLTGYWTHDWSSEAIRIASYDGGKNAITLAAPHHYGINAGTWGAARRRFYASNSLEELDAPGEWYLDREERRLYLLPARPLAESQVILATLSQPLVKLAGVHDVKFVDLVFEYGHADGIVASAAQGVEIAGCTVANCAKGGIALTGTGNTVRSCDLFQLGTYGIQINGGDRRSLSPGRNLAFNNHIHHYGLFQRTYAAGIGVQGCGNQARHNRIHDAPHNAVTYGGNDHLIESNEVSRVVMETGDAGAFYTGRDWTSQGNVLRHNFIHDLGGGDAKQVNVMGVYLDDCDCGDTIVGNVFFRAGRAIMVGGGRDNAVRGNLVVDCPIGLHIDARGMTWKQWNDPADKSWCLEDKAKQLNYTDPPWSERYPRLAAIMHESPREPLGNVVRGNVFVDCTNEVCHFDANVRKLLDKLDLADNLVVNTTGASAGVAKPVDFAGFVMLSGSEAEPIDLGFVDAKGGNFSLRSDARLRKETPGFEPIPFEMIGLVKDAYRLHVPAR